MLKVDRLQVGTLKTNCYLVTDTKTLRTAIVDAGDDADFIVKTIAGKELKPVLLIATHGHFDHVLATNELKVAYKIPFLMHKEDQKLLSWMRKSTKHFTDFDPGPPPKVDEYLEGGDKIKIGESELEIIFTPGHTPGGVGLYSKEDGFCLVGDTIFARGAIGRTDFPYADIKKLYESITRLLKLPKETTVYPGHGEETTIAKFKKEYNGVEWVS